jgi:hypothetical protein
MMNDNAAIRQAIRTVAFDEALAEHLGLNPTDLRCLELVIADPGLTPSRWPSSPGSPAAPSPASSTVSNARAT